MKILIKNKVWNVNFGNATIKMNVNYDFENKIFDINFVDEDEIIKIKSNNIDKTLAFLEKKLKAI